MRKEVIVGQKIGATFNTFILLVKKNSVDPGYSDAVQNDRLRLSRPISLYSIEKIRITGMVIDTNANNKQIVTFNGRDDLQMALADVKNIDEVFPKPTSENVREAILRQKNGSMPMIFTDYPGLLKQVTALNRDSKQDLERFINQQMAFIQTFEEAAKAEQLSCEAAMDELGLELK